MITKYKLDKKELVLNIKFLYDVVFKENDEKSIYKYLNLFLEKEKINFQGKKILIYVNGIFLGTIYLTKYYLKKIKIKNYKTLIDNTNSYFLPSTIVEIENIKI